MDFTYAANNNIERAVELSSSATTPPPTPQPFNNNKNFAEDKGSPKLIKKPTPLATTTTFFERDDLFTSFKETESRKRTLQQQRNFLYLESYTSEYHSSPLKKPVSSRFFEDLTSPIGTNSSYNKDIKLQHIKHHANKRQHHQKTMGPSLWCSSSCCTGKYQLNTFMIFTFLKTRLLFDLF